MKRLAVDARCAGCAASSNSTSCSCIRECSQRNNDAKHSSTRRLLVWQAQGRGRKEASLAPLANGKRSWRQWQQRLGVKTTLSAITATSIHIGDCCRCLPILPLVNRSSIIVSSRSALLPLLYRSSAAALPLFHHPRGLPSGGSTATSQQQPATVDIRGVYHLRGLPSPPPRNHQPSTSAGSTATSQQ